VDRLAQHTTKQPGTLFRERRAGALVIRVVGGRDDTFTITSEGSAIRVARHERQSCLAAIDRAGILRHIDQCLVPARIVVAIGDQVMHTLLAHIGERHRRAGWVLGAHSMNLVWGGHANGLALTRRDPIDALHVDADLSKSE
jgi:hypothetical protein